MSREKVPQDEKSGLPLRRLIVPRSVLRNKESRVSSFVLCRFKKSFPTSARRHAPIKKFFNLLPRECRTFGSSLSLDRGRDATIRRCYVIRRVVRTQVLKSFNENFERRFVR